MTRISRHAIPCALILGAILLASWVRADEPSEPVPAADPEAPPTYIFLKTPADLDALLKQLQRPDFLLKVGPEGDLKREPDRAVAGAEAKGPVVDTVAVRGEVVEDLAHLAIDFRIAIAGEGPVWVPLRLDGQTVTAVSEGDRELPHQATKEGIWQVELRGEGWHAVRVALLVPVRQAAEGRRIEMAIPEAAKTRIELLVARGASDALAGAREPVAIEPVEGGRRARLSAHLSPRRRLELTWRAAAEPGGEGPPLLVA
ncbi:MAG: hypothetical protein IRY99_19650, partial [Isosphaeraceae bacterium]|nr:hypothetical protein [Isosphaeraceae bacterium]